MTRSDARWWVEHSKKKSIWSLWFGSRQITSVSRSRSIFLAFSQYALVL